MNRLSGKRVIISPADARAQLMTAARELFPSLDGAWAESEADRRLPHRVVEEMRSAGLFRMVVPSELGGAEADLRTFLDVLEVIAYANGSAGWDLATSSMETLFAVGFPEEGIEQIYGSGPDVILAGTVTTDRDAAKAIAVEGGYRISGRWRFGSGCQDADWMMASAPVFDDAQPRTESDGLPHFRYAAFPRKTVDIIDTWHVLGMRGTGSHDWAVQSAFVPEGLTANARVVLQRLQPRQWNGTLYRFPLFVIAALHFSAVATGLARRAIDTLVELAHSKTPHRSSALLRARVQVQEAVARAEVELESARAYRDRVVDDAWKTVDAGGTLSLDQRSRVRLAGTHAAQSAATAVDLMYACGGTTSIQDNSALSRCFRDVHVVVQSITVLPLHYEAIGRAFLGLEPGGLIPL